MKTSYDRKPARPFAYAAKGVLTNMVYDDSGQGILPARESLQPDTEDDGDKRPISDTVSATVLG